MIRRSQRGFGGYAEKAHTRVNTRVTSVVSPISTAQTLTEDSVDTQTWLKQWEDAGRPKALPTRLFFSLTAEIVQFLYETEDWEVFTWAEVNSVVGLDHGFDV